MQNKVLNNLIALIRKLVKRSDHKNAEKHKWDPNYFNQYAKSVNPGYITDIRLKGETRAGLLNKNKRTWKINWRKRQVSWFACLKYITSWCYPKIKYHQVEVTSWANLGKGTKYITYFKWTQSNSNRSILYFISIKKSKKSMMNS